jgi:predicted nucleic acid-binding protein
LGALVLDSEALFALTERRRTDITRRVRALLAIALDRDYDVVVPSAALAELYRGTPADASIDRVLAGRGLRVVTAGRRIVRVAGALRHRDRLDSCHVVDCIVVGTTIRLGGGVVATGDRYDMESLARDHPNVVVHPITDRSEPNPAP